MLRIKVILLGGGKSTRQGAKTPGFTSMGNLLNLLDPQF